MNREDLIGARKHAQRMLDKYTSDIEGRRCECGCNSIRLHGERVEMAEQCIREYRATVEAIDMALESLGDPNE